MWELILENFKDPINQILLAAAIVSVVIGLIRDGLNGLIDGVSIFIALFIITVVNSGNNYVSERKLRDLIALSDKQEVATWRNSIHPTTMDIEGLVVGDVYKIETGMKIPADSILLEGKDIECCEADFTGESGSVRKTPLTPENAKKGAECTLLAKSVVTMGNGRALVVAVGPNTQSGIICMATRTENEPTPLQDKLEGIAYLIGNVGITCAVLTFLAMVVRIALEMTHVLPCGCHNLFKCEEVPSCIPYSFKLSFEDNRLWSDLLEALIISITIIVVAIPEGLPLAVTISLSYSSAQMRKLNNLVRSLDSCETMGGATYICTDKTGTLTQNQMTVMASYSLQQAFSSG